MGLQERPSGRLSSSLKLALLKLPVLHSRSQDRNLLLAHGMNPHRLPKATSYPRGNPVPQACTPSSEAKAQRPLWAHHVPGAILPACSVKQRHAIYHPNDPEKEMEPREVKEHT